MINTLIETLNSQKIHCLEIDRLIDVLRVYIPDGDEDYCRLIEENKKLLNTLNELIAGIKRVKEKIDA